MRDNIPLQTPMGDYRPSWLRKNRWWILTIVGIACAMVIGSVISTSLSKPVAASLTFNVVTSDALPLKVQPDELHHPVSIKGKTSTQEFSLTNTSTAPVRPFFSIAPRGTADFTSGELEFVNAVAPELTQAPKIVGSVKLPDDTRTIKFELEAVSGLNDDNSIAANTTAVFRLSATNTMDQKDAEYFLLLLISILPR